MHIGIDFDNTIVDYDEIFYKCGLKLGMILPKVEKTKQAVRDDIQIRLGNKYWIRLQELVYGKYICEAKPKKGIEKFLLFCKRESIPISIISHKTKYGISSQKTNLRKEALKWLVNHNFFTKYNLCSKNIFFVDSRNEKIEKIKKQRCTHFIDDLIEVFFHPDFPTTTVKILYGFQKNLIPGIISFSSWRDITIFFSHK